MPAKRDASRPQQPAGVITRRYEGKVPGGRSVQPHALRGADSRREKIEEMKRQARDAPKIGSSPP
jgi:hypothetical protein